MTLRAGHGPCPRPGAVGSWRGAGPGWFHGGWLRCLPAVWVAAAGAWAQSLSGPLWSTYVGGTGDDWITRVAARADGRVAVAGGTLSGGWIHGGFDTDYGGSGDGFVVVLDALGARLWSTYLGGGGADTANAVAMDAEGNVFVVGSTRSTGWAKQGWDTTHGGGSDGFLAKLAADGSLAWSTYLGGTADDACTDVAITSQGHIVVAGATASAGWAGQGTGTAYNGGTQDAFAAAFDADGGLRWAAYLGGDDEDAAYSLAVAPTGRLAVTGSTRSEDWFENGFDLSPGGGTDAFVLILGGSGAPDWGTYLGGSGDDTGLGVAWSADGAVLVAGETSSAGWTAAGADVTHNGGSDGFAAKLGADGAHVWSTYLGGTQADDTRDIAVDGDGHVLLSGLTYSGIWLGGGLDVTYGGSGDGYVAKLDAQGGHLWSAYLGGFSQDTANGIAVDDSGTIVAAGESLSTGWLRNSVGGGYNGSADGFVYTLTDVEVPLSYLAEIGPDQVALGRGLWDVTGPYGTAVEGNPLVLDLAQDAAGRLTGTGSLILDSALPAPFDVPLTIKGKVKGARGVVSLKASAKGRLKGIPGDAAAKVQAALKITLALEPDTRLLTGQIVAKVKRGKESQTWTAPVQWALPADMDGTFTQAFDLLAIGVNVTGTGTLTLSNGRACLLEATGTAGNGELKLQLAGDSNDPDSRGIRMQLVVLPGEEGAATLEGCSGKAFGQSLRW
ncbi:MAG: SBBP repeat-containing protein [Lentisphaeria bacterium]|nr:SBBP repeat-containing protein [Lentisphaeria bacterium]